MTKAAYCVRGDRGRRGTRQSLPPARGQYWSGHEGGPAPVVRGRRGEVLTILGRDPDPHEDWRRV